MREGITLIGITCEECNTYYFTKTETNESKCPECKHENAVMVYEDDLTDKEVEMMQNMFKETKDILSTYGLEVSNVDVFQFIAKVCKKLKDSK